MTRLRLERGAIAYARTQYVEGGTQAARRRSEIDGIQRQLTTCRRIAERLGADIVAEYVDYGSANDDVRPGLKQALGALQSEMVDYLIVDDVVRLARKSVWKQRVQERLDATGTKLVTAAAIAGSAAGDTG